MYVNKISIIVEKIKNFYNCLLSILICIRYSPEKISLINDYAMCTRYGHIKYEKENDKYSSYNINRYFKYPFPM